MVDAFANVPEWCRPGAQAVITVGTDEHAESGARETWRAVTITDVSEKRVTARSNRPYVGRFKFRPAGPDARPRVEGKAQLYLAPADAPDVIAQRRRRDEAKRGHKPTDQ